jgi:hypothetical protein
VIPHWSGIVFIFPLMCILYIDLLGSMRWAGKCFEFATIFELL